MNYDNTTITSTVNISANEHIYNSDIQSGAIVNVSFGGLISSGSIKPGGIVNVSSGGLNHHVLNSGTRYIFSGGIVSNGTVASGGIDYVLAGGSTFRGMIASGGTRIASSGGIVEAPYLFGTVVLKSGATLKDTYGNIQSTGLVSAEQGARLSGTISNAGTISGGTLYGTINNSSGGLISGQIIQSGGIVNNSSGGLISGQTIQSGGIVNNRAGASAVNQTVLSGGILNASSGGGILNTNVSNGGTLNLLSGATTTNTSALSGGVINEFRVHNAAVVNYGGTWNFYNSINTSSLIGSGTYNVCNGGIYTGSLTIISDVTFNVMSGGIVSAGDIQSGSIINVSFGGLVSAGYIRSGAIVNVSSGGLNKDVINSGTRYVFSGGVVSNGVVEGGAIDYVLAGGSTYEGVIDAGGTRVVSSGGVAEAPHVSGTLELKSGATLNGTYSNGGILSGAIVSAEQGAILSGVISNTGTISGGTLYGTVNNASGGVISDQIVGTGGTISNAGIISGGSVDGTINNASGGVVSDQMVSAGGTISNAGIISGGSVDGTIDNASGGVVSDQIVSAGGTISNAGIISGGSVYGTIDNASGGVVSDQIVSAGGTISNAGIISGGSVYGTVNNSSGGVVSDQIISSGGTLNILSGAIVSNTSVSSDGIFNVSSGGKIDGTINVDAGGKLAVDSQAGGTINLQNENSQLIITGTGKDGATTSVTTAITGFDGTGSGDSSTIILAGITPADVSNVEFVNASGAPDGDFVTLTLKDGSKITMNIVGAESKGYALGSSSDGLIYEVCFLTGSMIKTLNGEVAVENIQIGDQVLTFDWQQNKEVVRSICWVGSKQAVVKPGLPDDKAGYPVRVLKDAIAQGVPYKDLLITAEHSLFFDGKFIPVRMLVNGSSIFYDRSIMKYTYYHIETEEHSVIWADGMLTESYLDTGNRNTFKQHGDLVLFVGRQEKVKTWDDAAAPLSVDRFNVEAVYNKIIQRHQDTTLIQPIDNKLLTKDNDIHLVTKNRTVIRPHFNGKDKYTFLIPEGVSEVFLRSRTSRPCDVIGSFVDDRRYLGVLVGEISVINLNHIYPITDHLFKEDLEGWDVLEQSPCRWTNGNAKITLNCDQLHKKVLTIQVLSSNDYLLEDKTDILEIQKTA